MIRTTLAQAQQFILQKNFLAGEKAADLLELGQRLVGLPAEPETTPFLAVQARLAEFSPELLLEALYRQRHLIKSPLMHGTDYIVPAEQYLSLLAATARQRNQIFNAEFRLWGIETNEAMEALAQAILAALAEQPMTLAEVTQRLKPELVKELSQTSRGGRVTTTSNVALALRWLVARGEVAISSQSTDWREEALIYARLAEWYPDLAGAPLPGEAEAQRELVRTYLAAFGPATEADISAWTGFGKSETARASGALSRETTLVMVEGIPGMLLLLKSQAEALNTVEVPVKPIINLLPANDPFTTAYRASRSRYFGDPKLQRQLFSSSGAAKSTIVLNGQIVGLWEWPAETNEDLTWQVLAEIDPAWLPLIEAEVEQVAAFVGAEAERKD